MKRAGTLALTLLALAVSAGVAVAQANYPPEVLEKYAECQERTDLKAIQDLLWYHRNVEKVDASQYGLPKDDFDDRQLLTIQERLRYRAERKQIEARSPGAVPQATSGPMQYPHYLREAYDHWYEETGQKPDCSKILQDYAGQGAPPPDEKTLASSWASDSDLTSADINDRGEVNVVIDHASENRILASSCPSGASGNPDSSSNFISSTSDWGQTWSYTAVGNNSGSTWECDPVSYYQTSTGDVYHSKIGCSTGTCSSTYVMMRRSPDNGTSWSDCGRPGSDSSEDRQWHTVDNTPSSPCFGNIYITWHNKNQEKVTSSTDNCVSWRTPTDLTGTYSAITPDINVAADGHVYVVWQNYSDSTFKIAGSDDCGASWTSPSAKTLTARNGDWSNNLISQCQRGVASQPYVDVDRAIDSPFYGRVYVMLAMFNNSCTTESGWSCSNWDSNWNSTCNYDLFFMYSDDDGSTFSAPVSITAADGNLVDNFMGYMRVDPVDGSIWVTYHRSSLNPTSAADRQKTYYVVKRSKDGGATWEEMTVSTEYGDERASGASTFERGDYNGLDAYDGVAWPLWIDRRGTTAEENVIVRKVCSEPAHWSERGASPTPPSTDVGSNGDGTVNISWAAPDVYWGDGNEDDSQRKYQLWVDGSLAQDNIAWTTTSITSYDPGNCDNHDYFIRAINQCGISKDYSTTTFAATGCCTGNPTSVDVTPNGPLTLCTGSAQTLSVTLVGGSAPFSYQWYRDGTVITGATSSSYSANDTGTHSYNCKVTGQGCTTGVQDPSASQITWRGTPDFAGLQSVTDAGTSTCGLDLAWNAASTVCAGPVTYNIYRSTSSGFTPLAGNRIATGVTGTTYSDTDSLLFGTVYYYIVRALDTSNGVEDANTVEHSGSPSGGGGTQTLYSENFDSYSDGNLAGWTTGVFSGDAVDWRGVMTCTANSSPKIFRAGGTTCTRDYGRNKYSFAAPPAVTVDATWTNLTLDFYHRWAFDAGGDGAYLRIALDGATTYTYVDGSHITTGAYNDSGGPWWSGSQSGFVHTVVDLDGACDDVTGGSGGCAGHDVEVAFVIYSDWRSTDAGWFIDDVTITATVGSPCSATSEVSSESSSYPAVMVRDDASATGYYLYFEPITGATSYNVYEGTEGSFYDHTCLVQGVTTTTMSSGTWNGFLRAEVTPSATGSHYYLVTELTGTAEGPIGFDSNDTARPNSGCP